MEIAFKTFWNTLYETVNDIDLYSVFKFYFNRSYEDWS